MADWTDQAEQMLKTWTEAQKTVWDSWQDFASRTTGATTSPQNLSRNPMEWFQQSMANWTDPGGVARDAGRQVFGSQFAMMRNLELLTNAWRTVAPKVDAGQDWQGALSDFTGNWFQQFTGIPANMMETTRDTQALWQSYVREWGPILQPWIQSTIEATGSGHLGEMMLGGSEGLSRLMQLEQDDFHGAPFGGLAEVPSIGVAREHQAKILRAYDAFVDLRKVMLEFNRLTAGALKDAVQNVIEKLVEKSKKGEKIESVRELNRLWLESADDIFTTMYASKEYLETQHGLSKAGMIYKIAQHDVVEMVLKNLNLPTRSELDDAYKTLYELRKEVRSLKKQLHGSSRPALTAKAKPKAKKRATTKKKASRKKKK